MSDTAGDILYDGKGEVFLTGIKIKTIAPLYVETPENDKAYDTAPGGTTNLGLADLAALSGTPMPLLILENILPNGFDVWVQLTPIEINAYASHYSFVPTRSSLSIGEGLSINGPFNCGQGTSSRCSFSTLPTPTPLEYGLGGTPETNQEHVFLDSRIGDIIVDEVDAANLIPGGLLPSSLNTYYNVGLPIQSGIPTISVSSVNGKLSVNNTGKVAYATGNEPVSPLNLLNAYTKCEAVITVENSSKLVIGADQSAKHGQLRISDGSTLHIKPGGTLRVTSDQSALIIKPGATLILDPGAIVILESSESRIYIEGKLVVNGDIHFAGLGYFDFTGTHTLELGPSADAFRLTGAGKANLFIRVRDNATLAIPDGKGLDLAEGAVELLGSEIKLGIASWCHLEQIKVYGNTPDGVVGYNIGNFIVDGCTFDGAGQPIRVIGASGSSSVLSGPSTAVRNTDFHNYVNGPDIQHRAGVLFQNCLFMGSQNNSKSYGMMVRHNFITLLKDCVINDHRSGGASSQSEPLSSDLSMGVSVEGGWVLWMDGGAINNCDIGIGNIVADPLTDAPTNVIMNHHATIRDCHTGIAMKGNASNGLVLMDCARILEIGKYGIYGQDIALVIDPLLLYKMSNGTNTADPNVFTRFAGGYPKQYINVCYMDKAPTIPLPAQYNFWGYIWGDVYPDTDPNQHISLKQNAGTGASCGTPFAADVSLAWMEEPLGCARELQGPETHDCATEIIPESPATVRQEFMAGMAHLENEDFELAKSTFGNVANLWQPTLPGYTTYCKTLIDASKSLSNGEERWQRRAESQGDLWFFPNPASSEVNITLPHGQYRLRVWDGLGAMVHETLIAGAQTLNVGQWPNGLYWLEALASDGSMRRQGKVAVQR
ncbi:MAG: T9SS type A sorting domain-containing protein [Saprospiraceae bacterium]|nr:T9SS type A sorting domain-containing protein [Saprospiraceae bacterium]